MKTLIIGQGDIGLPVSNTLAQQQYDVTAMARKAQSAYDLSENVAFIQQDATTLTAEQLIDYSHICIIVAPSERGEAGYKNSYLAIAQQIAKVSNQLIKLKRIVFISSTGVYEHNNGEWVDEYSETGTPERITSRIILDAEMCLRQAFGDTLVVIRPSGIYGINRLMRVRIATEIANGEREALMAGQAWTNRIMDTDLVTIIVKVLTIEQPKKLYLATDYQPVTSFELTTALCRHIIVNSSTSAVSNSETSKLPVLPKADSSIAISGKKIHSNIPLEWLEFADWQVGYELVLQSIE